MKPAMCLSALIAHQIPDAIVPHLYQVNAEPRSWMKLASSLVVSVTRKVALIRFCNLARVYHVVILKYMAPHPCISLLFSVCRVAT